MATSSPTRECAQCRFGLDEGSASQTGVWDSLLPRRFYCCLGQGDQVDVVGQSGEHPREEGDISFQA